MAELVDAKSVGTEVNGTGYILTNTVGLLHSGSNPD